MKQALWLFSGVLVAFWAVQSGLGFGAAARLAYASLTVLAAAIGATFLWLWRERATPLALGMAFSWLGAASIAAWWNHARGLENAEWMRGNPVLFVCLALYMTGAILHFAVISRSLDMPVRRGLVWGTAAATSLALVLALTG